MRNDYPIKGQTTEVHLKIEKDVADKLKMMSDQTKLTESEIANMAIKRFIVTHKDFLPASAGGSKTAL